MTKILLINDVQISLIACQNLITSAFPNVKIVTAKSGNEGVKKALKEIYDIIIINLAAPNDCIETCKRLKESDSALAPVILISSLPSNSFLRIKALEAGALLFLTKPINSTELIAQLKSVIKYKKDTNKLLEENQIMYHEKLRIDQLQLELKKAYKALDRSPVSVLITDLEGKIVYCNPKVSELTGYTVKDLHGQNPRIFQSGETPVEVYQDMWNTVLSGKEWHGEFHNKKRNGEMYWESALISPVFNPAGSIINFLAVKEDITEYVRL
ncbi:MAG: PAS domain S-box protein [Ignavibacteriaceae bacterium]